MKITIRNLRNEEVGELEVPEGVLDYPFNEHLVHIAVKSYLAGQRRGTHKTKVRSEVRGSGKKLWRQKGTGRARVGSIRTPLWRSGGTVHGPQPRSYATQLSVREKKNALKAALSRKLEEESMLVLDELALDSHRTQELIAVLDGLGVHNKALLVDSCDNEKLELAARNNPKLKTVDALAVNVYDVVDRDYIVLSTAAFEKLVEVLSK